MHRDLRLRLSQCSGVWRWRPAEKLFSRANLSLKKSGLSAATISSPLPRHNTQLGIGNYHYLWLRYKAKAVSHKSKTPSSNAVLQRPPSRDWIQASAGTRESNIETEGPSNSARHRHDLSHAMYVRPALLWSISGADDCPCSRHSLLLLWSISA